MTDVEKSEILHTWHVYVENVAIYAKFIAIYAVLQLDIHQNCSWSAGQLLIMDLLLSLLGGP